MSLNLESVLCLNPNFESYVESAIILKISLHFTLLKKPLKTSIETEQTIVFVHR